MTYKHDIAFTQCMNMNTGKSLINNQLSEKEIEMMRYLYRQQYSKKDILEYFYYSWKNIPKIEVLKTLGSLNKKGLIYGDISLPSLLGTKIKI